MKISISDMYSHFRTKAGLVKMIEKLGKTESAKRMAWLHDCHVEEFECVMDQFLTDNYLDDKGVKGGSYFWSDL